ncbi:MAG: sigma-54-dependent Fis family transcriptional regulator [Candidatus Latescibacterota bacterium]|nr:MAG: sigma-54-dependent Fis family transcriptional regulator [Candidatus Latescibacterota bacterium]
MPAEILVIDDEANIRKTLQSMLELEDYGVITAPDAAEGLKRVADADLVLLDVRLPDRDGLDVLQEIRSKSEVPVLMMSAHGTIATAVRATQLGADDFLEKPFSSEKVLVSVRNALRLRQLESDRAELEARAGVGSRLLGESAGIRRVREQVALCAKTPGRVLITGETGTGKEVVARAIHSQSDRRRGPWVAVNCAAVPGELIESELFGHEKGAFTGALRTRRGKFEQAHRGTLFLDEIGDMPAHMQAKLLRVLEEGEVERVGSDRRLRVDVRVVAATNRDLGTDIDAGRFREDLYHRLNVVAIHITPLRERPEDVPILVQHFVESLSTHAGLRAVRISSELMQHLQQHVWPGNVRELRNTVERLLIFSRGREPSLDLLEELLAESARTAPTGSAAIFAPAESSKTHSLPPLPAANADPRTLREAAEEFERAYIRQRLRANGGQVAATARELGLERSHLYKKMRALGIDPEEAR